MIEYYLLEEYLLNKEATIQNIMIEKLAFPITIGEAAKAIRPAIKGFKSKAGYIGGKAESLISKDSLESIAKHTGIKKGLLFNYMHKAIKNGNATADKITRLAEHLERLKR